MKRVAVTGAFDDLRSGDIRFLQEAARLGSLSVRLWSDEAVRAATGKAPKFPFEERRYLLEAIRYVDAVIAGGGMGVDGVPVFEGERPDIWAVRERDAQDGERAAPRSGRMEYRVLDEAALRGFPVLDGVGSPGEGRKKVIVTGCYDWFHSGHVAFFEEASGLGDLYVVVGHDANIRLLKGEGHPMLPEDERRYVVQSVRYVTQALVSSGQGWLDAEPEIRRIRPDLYAVNEDGDKPEKREFCEKMGIEYVVFKRVPKAGLPRRQSTDLRGF